MMYLGLPVIASIVGDDDNDGDDGDVDCIIADADTRYASGVSIFQSKV